MRTVIQRVSEASVTIDHKKVSFIKEGLLIFIGITPEDDPEDVHWLIKKISQLRIFNDDEGVMNRSLLETEGDVLVVSQFTLHAKTKKGNRPSYIRAAKPEHAIPLYERFVTEMEKTLKKSVKTGVFGAKMNIALINDGPVTIFIDTKQKE